LRKTPNFFAENWQKSEKIVIITLTADWANFRQLGDCFLKAISITLTLLRLISKESDGQYEPYLKLIRLNLPTFKSLIE
jgi:hypothetical protein